MKFDVLLSYLPDVVCRIVFEYMLMHQEYKKMMIHQMTR